MNETSMSGNEKPPFRQRAWEFWKRNNIIFVQLPLMLAWLFLTYVVLKSIDPRIGVEGFGDIFGYALMGVRIVFIVFTVFWVKKWMLFDLYDKTELELFKEMRAGNWMSFWIVLKDRVEWAVLLYFATKWYGL